MRQISYEANIHAPREKLWKLLLDRVENPRDSVPGLLDVRIIERYDGGLLREVMTQGMTVRERVTIDEPKRMITYTMVDHPLFSGRVVTHMVPASVQSPVAPLRLTMTVEWVPKDDAAERLIQENMPEQIQREVLTLKEMAEEGE